MMVIEGEKARERSNKNLLQNQSDGQNSDARQAENPGRADEKAAQHYGISRDTLRKEMVIPEVVSYFAERYGIEEERNA